MIDDLHGIWRRGAFAVPEAQSGRWQVKRTFITPEDEAENRRHAQVFGGPLRYSPAGYYTALLRDDDVWMADTPDEMRDHLECYEQARIRGGRVLIHGLGLGLIVRAVLSLPNVTFVDVVELEQDVIDLVHPVFAADIRDLRLRIRHGDCFTAWWPDRAYWEVVWHDVWQGMVEANLPEMDRLHRMFAPRCDWQGSWGREWILDQRRRRIASGSPIGTDAKAVASYVPDP